MGPPGAQNLPGTIYSLTVITGRSFISFFPLERRRYPEITEVVFTGGPWTGYLNESCFYHTAPFLNIDEDERNGLITSGVAN